MWYLTPLASDTSRKSGVTSGTWLPGLQKSSSSCWHQWRGVVHSLFKSSSYINACLSCCPDGLRSREIKDIQLFSQREGYMSHVVRGSCSMQQLWLCEGSQHDSKVKSQPSQLEVCVEEQGSGLKRFVCFSVMRSKRVGVIRQCSGAIKRRERDPSHRDNRWGGGNTLVRNDEHHRNMWKHGKKGKLRFCIPAATFKANCRGQ